MSTATRDREAKTMSIYDRLGGGQVFHRLAGAFYARVERDPVLRPMYPRHLRCAQDNLAHFLTAFFGGPPEYSLRRASLREAHARFRIGTLERESWLACMLGALDDLGVEEPVAEVMRGYFAEASAFLINQPGETAGGCEGESGTDNADGERAALRAEVARRWDAVLALEELFAAVRGGDAACAIALLRDPRIGGPLVENRLTLMSVLALMGCSGCPESLEWVRSQLEREPALVGERHGGEKMLLHEAAGAWAVSFVALLLGMGADPNALDGAGHTPLYYVGNAFPHAGKGEDEPGTAAATLLVRSGADVHAAGGAKGCTALHMAARRGHVGIARSLLEHGAAIEARDRMGDTPLRRAVNCGKPEMVAFLLSRGADVHAKGSRGATPREAARGSVMRRLLEPDAGELGSNQRPPG
jgi:truncated hemoglobin YjbI